MPSLTWVSYVITNRPFMKTKDTDARLKKKTMANTNLVVEPTLSVLFFWTREITDLPERNSMYFPPLDFFIPNFDQSQEHRSIWILL